MTKTDKTLANLCTYEPAQHSGVTLLQTHPPPFANRHSSAALGEPAVDMGSVRTAVYCLYALGSVVSERWYSRPSSAGTGARRYSAIVSSFRFRSSSARD